MSHSPLSLHLNRRRFLSAIGSVAITSIAAPARTHSSLTSDFSLLTTPGKFLARIAVLWEPGFPSPDGLDLNESLLRDALDGFHARFVGMEQLGRLFALGEVDVLVTPFGSAFPKQAWREIEHYLAHGGNWVNLGGAPLTVPVRRDGGGWHAEVRQTAYHKRLGITQSFPLKGEAPSEFIDCPPGAEGLGAELSVLQTFAMYVRLTTGKHFPNEDGSAGPRDATMRPLVYGMHHGWPVSAPVVCLDRLRGRYRGGRWVFAAFNGRLTPAGIRALVGIAAERAYEFTVRTSYARYRPGESIYCSALVTRPRSAGGGTVHGECRVSVADESGKPVGFTTFEVRERDGVLAGRGPLPVKSAGRGGASFYRITARCTMRGGFPELNKTLTHESGFWIASDDAIRGGDPITNDGTYLRRADGPFPVTGTTYMASDVHRKFLLEPSPYVWEKDFEEMANAGVNLVRTGIWTGWSLHANQMGKPHEGVLRAMDAYVLSATRRRIPVIFTFFAFLPETWGGENPYLDPTSIAAQKEFVGAFARRYAGVDDIIWDLINEPSFCSAKHLWQCRPNYDKFELEAWRSWLRRRYPAASERERLSRLQEMWRGASDEPEALPALQDFEDTNIFYNRRPNKSFDYKLFAQEMFTGWVGEMTAAIRENGNPRQVVTVGQDEGGSADRPAPLFHATAVGMTSIHTWWANDDLLWDGVVTKSPGTPNLIEETGVMFYENMGGHAWRGEEEAARLLERKLVLAFASGGAGYVQWIWNTNPYMDSENEAAIGLRRADGSVKPEFFSFMSISRWLGGIAKYMSAPEPDPVVLVVPQSSLLSVRNQAIAVTRAAVRTLSYRCGIGVQAVGEYQLVDWKGSAPLIVLPSPSVLSRGAWDVLLRHVEEGATIVVSGAFDGDEHWLPTGRMVKLGLPADTVPVAQEELVEIDGMTCRVSFRGEKMQRVLKSGGGGDAAAITTLSMGKGRILWSPIPLELSDETEPLVRFYSMALRESGVEPTFSVEGGGPVPLLFRSLVFEGSVLYLLVNESGAECPVRFTHRETGLEIPARVRAGKTSMILVSRTERSEIARWPA